MGTKVRFISVDPVVDPPVGVGEGFGVLAGVQASVGTCSVPTGSRTAGEWMTLVAECSAALGVLAAARDAAIVRLAAIEEHVDEDGVVTEQVNGLGTVCLDADAMVRPRPAAPPASPRTSSSRR